MNQILNLALSAFAAALSQFALLVGTGVTAPLPLAAGVAGMVGVAIVQHMRQLPRKEWTDEQRSQKETPK